MRIFTLFFGILFFAVFAASNAHAQSPNWLWAKSATSSDYENGNSICSDANGNSYITGECGANFVFGAFSISYANIFVAKLNAAGDLQWMQTAKGYATSKSICVDASGNVLVTGYFSGDTIRFGAITLVNFAGQGSGDIFVVKYDPSGNVLWAKRVGGNSADISNSISVDASGNTFITGKYSSSSILFGSNTLTNVGGFDFFIAKFDASGNVLWAKNAGTSTWSEGKSICVDPGGNVCVAGRFQVNNITFGTITLQRTIGSVNLTGDVFIVKYNSTGTVLWAKSAGGINEDLCTFLKVDASGNIYITGSYKSPNMYFDSNCILNSSGTPDVFIAKYNSSGTPLWYKGAGGTGADEGESLDIDASGNIHLTGYFSSSGISFVSISLASAGGDDIFIVKYNSAGTPVSAVNVGGTGNDYAFGLSASSGGSLFLTGYFLSPAISFGTTTLANAGNWDFYVSKFDYLTKVDNEYADNADLLIYPNPVTNILNIETGSEIPLNFDILNIIGQAVYSSKVKNRTSIDMAKMPDGVYFIKLESNNGTVVRKFIKK